MGGRLPIALLGAAVVGLALGALWPMCAVALISWGLSALPFPIFVAQHYWDVLAAGSTLGILGLP